MKLFYRKYGNGPPLIILHGLFGSSDNWVTIAKKISGSYTVYIPDMRNHGNSPHSDFHDYMSMGEDLFELATELKLKKFFLAGHSMGGKTAIYFAMRWPEMLNGLLVADISPFANDTNSQLSYFQYLSILDSVLAINISDVSSRNEVDLILSRNIESDKIRGLIMKNLQRNEKNIFSWKLNAISLRNNLKNIMGCIERPGINNNQITGFPVIFLKGEVSEYLPSADFSDIQRLFPSVEFVVIEKAGHWIHADNSDQVADNLLKLMINN
jgi:pimeloyl-ACP methyl ester carboxylesterase